MFKPISALKYKEATCAAKGGRGFINVERLGRDDVPFGIAPKVNYQRMH